MTSTLLLLTYRDAWAHCRKHISAQVGGEVFEAFFSTLRLESVHRQVVRLTVVGKHHKNLLLSRYAAVLLAACRAEWPHTSRVQVGIRSCIVRDLRTVTVRALPAPAKSKQKLYRNKAWRYAKLTPRELFPGHPGEEPFKWPTMDEIQRATLRQYPLVTRAELLSGRRLGPVVRVRQVAMYLCDKLTPHSLVLIGQKFGNKDHTTVLHAKRKISWKLGERCGPPPAHFKRDPSVLTVDPVLVGEIEQIYISLGLLSVYSPADASLRQAA